MNSFGEQVLSFYKNLGPEPGVPVGVKVLFPHRNAAAWQAMNQFYSKFYHDTGRRIFLIGINPGRLGAGTTGIPFTDPIRLKEVCGITSDFEMKAELSSKFIYHMIANYGGAGKFYQHCYFTSVSPLGFTSSGKNLNYYDLRELQTAWESFMVKSLKNQIKIGADPVAFSLGKGQNHQYLLYLNKKYQLFKVIHPLPHPRWIMQYRLKRLEEFVQVYCDSLRQFQSK